MADAFVTLVAIQPTAAQVSTATSSIPSAGQPRPAQGIYSSIRTTGVKTK